MFLYMPQKLHFPITFMVVDVILAWVLEKVNESA